MKNLNKNHKTKGLSLVAAIAIMLILAILGMALISMLGTTSRGVVDYQRSGQAFGLAQGGLNWYMMQLAGIANWTATTNQTDISLGQGTFDITLSNKAQPQIDSSTATRVDITVTGKVIGTDGVTIQRIISQRVWKLPSAAKFALFWGRLTGANLTLNSIAINGDLWSRGTTSIPSGSSVTSGTAYRPDNQDITGTGTYTEVSVTSPYPVMPVINSTYYTDLINTYDAMIDANTSSTDVTQTTNLVLTGNTINCRNFFSNGNITISGNGFIVANQFIYLHSRAPDSGTLTISPSGGNIVFLAARSLTVNSAQADTTINGNPGIRMYVRSQTTTGQLLMVQNDTTNINGALFLAQRRISVEDSANLVNCTLFVNDAGSTTNNNLTVTDSGTSVGTTSSPCSLISIGRGSPSLAITTTASVVGFVYQRDTNNLGSTNIAGSSSANRVNITGSIVANQFYFNNISNANITYDPTVIPDPPLEGFDGFATKKPNSWSGN